MTQQLNIDCFLILSTISFLSAFAYFLVNIEYPLLLCYFLSIWDVTHSDQDCS